MTPTGIRPLDKILGPLYGLSKREREVFGDAWCGPDRLEHNELTVVARYEPSPGSHPVEVKCTATPSPFYLVDAKPTVDLDGHTIPGFGITTGSGSIRLTPGTITPSGFVDMAEIAHVLAVAISQGMLATQP